MYLTCILTRCVGRERGREKRERQDERERGVSPLRVLIHPELPLSPLSTLKPKLIAKKRELPHLLSGNTKIKFSLIFLYDFGLKRLNHEYFLLLFSPLLEAFFLLYSFSPLGEREEPFSRPPEKGVGPPTGLSCPSPRFSLSLSFRSLSLSHTLRLSLSLFLRTEREKRASLESLSLLRTLLLAALSFASAWRDTGGRGSRTGHNHHYTSKLQKIASVLSKEKEKITHYSL